MQVASIPAAGAKKKGDAHRGKGRKLGQCFSRPKFEAAGVFAL